MSQATPDPETDAAIEQIGVIGAGQMGCGIAHVCALAGFDVRLADLSEEVGRERSPPPSAMPPSGGSRPAPR